MKIFLYSVLVIQSLVIILLAIKFYESRHINNIKINIGGQVYSIPRDDREYTFTIPNK